MTRWKSFGVEIVYLWKETMIRDLQIFDGSSSCYISGLTWWLASYIANSIVVCQRCKRRETRKSLATLCYKRNSAKVTSEVEDIGAEGERGESRKKQTNLLAQIFPRRCRRCRRHRCSYRRCRTTADLFSTINLKIYMAASYLGFRVTR